MSQVSSLLLLICLLWPDCTNFGIMGYPRDQSQGHKNPQGRFHPSLPELATTNKIYVAVVAMQLKVAVCIPSGAAT